MTTEWQIVDLEKKPTEGSFSNVCKSINWVVIDRDESSNIASYKFGETTLESPSSSSFVAFDDLTEDTCIGWVKNILGSTETTSTETGVTSKLTELKDSSITRGIPWLS